MRSLDVFTLMFMTAFTCVGMSMIMFSVHRSFRSEVQGVGHWAWGQLAMVLAVLMLALRGTLPDVLSVPASNAALLWGIGLSMIGTQLFYGQAASWRLFHIVWGSCFIGILWWLLVTPDFAMRVALYSCAELVLHLVQLRLVVRYGERHFTSYFFFALLLVQAALVLIRGVAALVSDGASVDLLKSSALATSYLAISNLVILLLSVAFLVLASRRLQLVLEQRSTHDPLTGILNRRGFGEFFGRKQIHARQGDWPLAILALDLDHFKAVNDRYGHAMGDRVLQHVATLVQQALRERDRVARFGGEEFVALLPGTSAKDAIPVALRIQAALRDAVSELPSCTLSIGIASQSSELEDLDSLLARADAALYRAKAEGRNRIVLADEAVLRCVAG
ncbi:GGDEF domain-containing protein [Massilia cavernae]|nr:GGDEF domain-containing protein [Massilia cavernae]